MSRKTGELSMTYKNIFYEVKEKVAWITLNQPEKRNPLSNLTMRELIDALEKAKAEGGASVIVITGAGEKAFCAGADIGEFRGNTVPENREQYGLYARLCLTFPALGKPSIAAVNGLALAGGCGLALYPDITIASEKARFGVPEITVGVWPMMVSASLYRAVGRKKALELMCTGEMIDAHEALRIGLVNRVVPPDQLQSSVMDLAEKLKSKSPVILKLGLDAFYTMADLEYSKAVIYLREMVALLLNTEDAQEGVTAFVEKRKPVWKGK